jgi:hypothetical protein
MKKVSLFRRMKVSQRPDALSMSEAERKAAIANAKMDRHDILEFLSGENVQLIDGEPEEIEACRYSEIYEALKLYHKQIKGKGPDKYITQLQREGGFDPYENEAAKLVAGLGADLSKIRRIPEKALKEWLISYLHCLAEGQWKAERKATSHQQHGGIGHWPGMF